ncbi:hypothetical protein [Desulforamulus ferrireducens]|uniref:Uncharacterized protein n=1 Tax=Desulforamulus ferrireducens TaxID=1833852 RepID=A0A1S6IWF2_9FIRM|nr:hypothetical protein [Desulforamulus ferrireducens]AQS59109.1 hypothetical protein B0537_08465 [Desulforamulus ferrireducens]
MFFFSILFYFLAGLTILAIILGITVDAKYYWIGALTSYLCSILGSWSIGIYILNITFALLALAFAHKMGWIKNPWHSILVIVISTLIWVFSILTIDDAWLFFPARFIFS